MFPFRFTHQFRQSFFSSPICIVLDFSRLPITLQLLRCFPHSCGQLCGISGLYRQKTRCLLVIATSALLLISQAITRSSLFCCYGSPLRFRQEDRILDCVFYFTRTSSFCQGIFQFFPRAIFLPSFRVFLLHPSPLPEQLSLSDNGLDYTTNQGRVKAFNNIATASNLPAASGLFSYHRR